MVIKKIYSFMNTKKVRKNVFSTAHNLILEFISHINVYLLIISNILVYIDILILLILNLNNLTSIANNA